MAAPEVTALLKRGKRSVASFFKAECFRQCGTHRTLQDFLNFLFDPKTKSIDDLDVLDWCRWLIAGGATFDEFGKTVRQYDNAVICGLVWTANFVAYRCRTCGISPCMSLCSECFQAGDHEGHDFNMFRSQAGGACDCGDISVMNKDGFCSRHGPDRHKFHVTPPSDLLTVAEIMMPRILLRLIHYLRDSSKQVLENRDTYQLSLDDAEQFLTFLHSLSDMGAAMRSVLSKALTDTEMYKNLTEVAELPDKSNKYYVDSQIVYRIAVDLMNFPKSFSDFSDVAGLKQRLVHKTFLQELVFWTVKFEFPQKVVTLLLSLLPDDHYKEEFTRAFIEHYSRISLVLVGGLSRPSIANRVVHISVQLFSNEKLACQMVKEYNLLYILILSLTHMVENIVTESTLQDAQSNFHYVVDCGNEAMKDHCYWPIVSDLINLLSHREIAHQFLADNRLITMWIELLSYFQGMNLNQRELCQHVEFEPETYYAAFSAELEIASSPMWSLLSHCREKDTAQFSLNMIKLCREGLNDWFEAIGCKDSTKPNPLQLTFHLPLHRYLATFMYQAIQHQDVTFKDIGASQEMLKTILLHLLQMQVCVSEIYNGMWVRNGLQIKGQAMTYIQCHFCYSMIDADLYLMQVCACKLDPDYFVQTVLERFHILKWLSFSSEEEFSTSTYKLEPNQELAMVDAALSFLATILGVRTYLGISDKELTKLEMTTLLCVADRQHSQLMELMPEKSGMTGHGKELFEPTLKEVADYKAPNFRAGNGLQQGTYVPKGSIWENDFDPVHVSLRAVYKKDVQSSMDRYTEYVKHTGKYSGNGSPWPPFKPPGNILPVYKDMFQILHCRTMHAFIFRLLNKCVTEPNVPESIIYHTIHLLNLSLTIPQPRDTCRRVTSFNGVVPDGSYTEWFGSNSILQNVREVIKEVQIPISVDNSFMTKLTMPSVEEMFQIAPSVVSTAGGPITAAHSGHLPSLPLVSMTTEVPMDTDPYPLVPIHSISSQSSSKPAEMPKYENKGVSTDQSQKVTVQVNESIVSLLVKLHSKLTNKQCSYVPLSVSNRQSNNSLIGDGPHFVAKVLDQICKANIECAKHTEEVYRTLLPKDSPKKKESHDKEERRRKARERQQKLMAQFASQQKAFMEQNQSKDNEDADDDMASASSSEQAKESELQSEDEHDCVICGKSSPPTADNPIGLVVLLQATSALGHRLPNENPLQLPVDVKIRYKPVNCASVSSKHLKTLLEHFEESSVQMSVNIGWEGGVLVQTCGHYLHLDCHNAYKASQMNQNNVQNLAVHKGEYWCPICRQLANSLIPILPDENKDTLVKPVSPDNTQMVKDIAEMMVTRPITPRSGTMTKAMGSVMEDLTNTTYGAYKTYTNSQTSESVLLFVCSVARTNLEIELIQREGKLCEQTSTSHKPCFSPLMDVLSMHSKILTTKPYTDLWSHITGVSCTEESSSVEKYHKEVPLMLKDPVSLLIQLVLTLPSTIEKEHYLFLVKALYNVTFVQALITTSCMFTPEEREAWKKKGRMVSFNTLDGMLSHVITRMGCSRLYEDDEMTDKDIPAICQSVWSPHSVDMAVQESCIPFLRIAALLKYHLFCEEFSGMQDKPEFLGLSQYLGLVKPGLCSAQVTSCSCVHWIASEPLPLTRAWCTELSNFIFNQAADAKSLLMTNNIWMPPSLIVLPQHYYKIFQAYSTKTCSVCSSVPKDPAICLVCGHFLCFRQSCCSQQSVYECIHHSVECGAGTGMYLLVNSSIVVVIRGPRATLWGSVYLDEHGEEDRDLKRGKPLFLSAQRYNLLKQQWISHNFDHSCKRWIWHLDRL